MLTTFIRKHAGHYNISEMSIVFGITAVGAIFPVLLIGLLLHYCFGINDLLVTKISLALWFGFVGWLWISFVITGRNSPHERVSTGELTAMQIICASVVGIHWLLASPNERHSWELIGRVFEWIIVGFHVIYFTLAWAMKARVPLRTYLFFGLILGLFISKRP